MLNEVIDDLLALAMGDPEDMASLYVDDVGGVLVASVKLEFVDTEVLCLPLGLGELAVPALDDPGMPRSPGSRPYCLGVVSIVLCKLSCKGVLAGALLAITRL